jgi:hypothetical protein
MTNSIVAEVDERSGSAQFYVCMDAILARIRDKRAQVILQIATASFGEGQLDRLQSILPKLPSDSRKVLELPRIAERLVGVLPQVVALDLDRVPPLRVLGIGRSTISLLFCAKSLGHDAVIALRPNFVFNQLLKLFGVMGFEQERADHLPEGPFDLIVFYGREEFGSKRKWREFSLPLADKLTEGGQLFVALDMESNPRKNYYPKAVLAKLSEMGVRVSSKGGFALLNRGLIHKIGSEPVKVESAIDTETYDGIETDEADLVPPGLVESDGPATDVDFDEPVIRPQETVPPVVRPRGAAGSSKRSKPFWNPVVVVGGGAILFGLLLATWAWAIS